MSNKISFKNAVRFTGSQNEFFDRKDIFQSLRILIGEHSKDVCYMSQFNSSNNWIIAFNEIFVASKLFGLSLNIKGKFYKLFDANEDLSPFKTQQFRLHWLPYGFDMNKIKSFITNFSKSIQVIAIDEEYCRDEEMKHVKTGNIRLKIRFLKTDEIKISTGVHKIDGFRTLLTRIGEKPKCLLCNKEGHVKRECELSKMKCAKCLKIGHDEASCNLANQIKSQNLQENLNLPNEDDEDLRNETLPPSIEENRDELFETAPIKSQFEKDILNNGNNLSEKIQELKQALNTHRRNSEIPKSINNFKANNNYKQSATPSTSTTTATTSNKRSNSQISPANDHRRKKNHHQPSQGEASENQKS